MNDNSDMVASFSLNELNWVSESIRRNILAFVYDDLIIDELQMKYKKNEPEQV